MRGIVSLSRFARFTLADIRSLPIPDFLDYLATARELAEEMNRKK